jgi:hypothetical protein
MSNRWLLAASLPLLLALDPARAQNGQPTVVEESGEPVEVVVVTGVQPGPPLWRVINGENVLYIFPLLSPVPKNMEWETGRVERVLAQSQEAILEPDVQAHFSTRILFNPINIFRGMRLVNRLSANPGDATIDAVLPPELYARYHALKIKYFPREDEPEDMRPIFAGAMLSERILKEEDLDTAPGIEREIGKLIRRTDGLVQTEITVMADLTGSFSELAERMETMVQSLSPDLERQCFEQEIYNLETDLEAMKSRANAWAQGRIDQFRGIPLPGDANDVCENMLFESSEFETLDQLTRELNRRWLEAAVRALDTNKSTFAMLNIVELLVEDGLLAELKARGYEVQEP